MRFCVVFDVGANLVARQLVHKSANFSDAEDVEHVTSTALWVLTNGETVTDEHLLRDRHAAEGEVC